MQQLYWDLLDVLLDPIILIWIVQLSKFLLLLLMMSLSFLTSPNILLLIMSSHHDQIEKLIESISIRKRTTTSFFFCCLLLVYLCIRLLGIALHASVLLFYLWMFMFLFEEGKKKKMFIFSFLHLFSGAHSNLTRVVHAGLGPSKESDRKKFYFHRHLPTHNTRKNIAHFPSYQYRSYRILTSK